MKIRSIILTFFAVAFIYVGTAQSDTQNPMRARFLGLFPKYIEWPEADKKGDFVVGFLGNDALVSAYTTKMTGKTVGAQSVSIKKYSSAKDIGKCHILYVAGDKSGELKTCLSKLKSSSTLVVTDKSGLINQSAINFVMVGPALKFEINTKNITANKLKFNPAFTKAATKVIE